MLNTKKLIRCGVVALFCLVALGLALVTRASQSEATFLPGFLVSGPSKVVSSPVSKITPNVLGYWTADKMKAARSADLLLRKKVAPTPVPSNVSGTPRSIDPVAPKKATQEASLAPDKKVQMRASTVARPYPSPYSTVGKVFFTDPQTNTDYVCSGTAVVSNNKDTVDTAGHCVANGGGQYFFTNWVFCARYYNGCNAKYLWAAHRLVTHRYWYQNGWLTYDYGMAAVDPNGSGNMTDVIGGSGVAYNQPYQQQFTSLGYPQAAPFDGSKLWKCASPLYHTDQPNPGPTTLSIICNMTGGSSGGGWLIPLNGKAGYLNGHNDYKYSDDSQHMYSPYYGDDWFSVYNTVQSA